MNQQQIEQIVQDYLQQAVAGADMENPKLDFKREWYKLDTEEGKQEFIADTSSITNTFGLDGYIIIGFDDNTKEFKPAPFKDCGLRDTSDMMNLISKSVDPIYTIHGYSVQYEGNELYVLHIPPSIAKPHVVRCYKTTNSKGVPKEEQHRILVRKGTGKQFANRNDIELMYYDRKNIVPEYEVIASFHKESLIIRAGHQYNQEPFYRNSFYKIALPLTIENIGRRPISIVSISVDLATRKYEKDEFFTLISSYQEKPIVLPYAGMSTIQLTTEVYQYLQYPQENAKLYVVRELYSDPSFLKCEHATIITSTGQELLCEIIMGTNSLPLT
jgi:hypothetical protein